MPMLNLRLARPGIVVDLSLLDELRGKQARGDRTVMGALTTHAEIEDGLFNEVASGFMTRVAQGIAYRAIRNHGTVGGSLAHADPAADWPTALSALDAGMVLESVKGQRQVPLGEFFLAPFTTCLQEGEIITRIEVPCRSDQIRWAYVKHARKVGEFAESIVAIVADTVSGFFRIAIGGLAGTPVLLPDDLCRQWLDKRPGEVTRAPDVLALERVLSGLPYGGDRVRTRIHAATLASALESLQ